MAAVILLIPLARAYPPRVQTQPTQAQLSPQELFRRVSRSVFVVEALDGNGAVTAFGSGVVLRRPRQRKTPEKLPADFADWDGDYVVTNEHVVEAAAKLRVRRGDQIWAARVFRCDAQTDLCRLLVPGLNAPPVPFRLSTTLQIGEHVYAVGAPEGLELSFSEGIISGIRELDGARRVIQTTAPVSHGSSGGGLFDSSGRLVGVTSFVLKEGQNLNFAVPAETILALERTSETAENSSGRDFARGNEAGENLCDVEPSESEKWRCRGDMAKSAGDPKGATEAYRRALQLDPRNDMAHAMLGITLQDQGDLLSAIEEFRKSANLVPLAPGPHLRLAKALQEKGDLDGAIAEYREAARLSPTSAVVHLFLGNALFAKGDPGAARLELRETVRLSPEDAQAATALCTALDATNDLNEALIECRRALSLKPDLTLLPRLHQSYGVLLQADGDLDGAIAEFSEVIRLQAENPEAHFHLGSALCDKSEQAPVGLARSELWPKAEIEFRTAIRLKPDYAEARLGLGRVLLWDGLGDRGDLLKQLPATPESLKFVLELPSPKIEQAITEFRKALSLEQNLSPAHYWLGRALQWVRRSDEALRELALACSLDSRHPRYCKDYEALKKVSGVDKSH